MKTKVSPTIIGAFVLGAVLLGIVALLAFGSVSFFSKPQRFVVYFDESIHGLDLGSPVKLRGVRVGRVVALNVSYQAETNRSVVAVTCELNRNIITDTSGEQLDVSSRAELQRLVDRGMRAQLGILGLATGLLFVELDFQDPELYPPGELPPQARYVTVPAVPSAIQELQTNLSEILNDLRKIDFAGISNEFKGLIVDTRKQLAGVDLRGAVEQWKKTGAQIETLANRPEVGELLTNLNGAITDLRGSLAKLDSQVGANGDQLQATLAQTKSTLENFNAAAGSMRRFIAAQSGVGEQATRALEELASAAEAVRRLADFLERNPQALISGRASRPE
ncbi:MAG: MlaD family protein [Opitutus sp.]|nr:MlaD family protein [Opitutus sp.]